MLSRCSLPFPDEKSGELHYHRSRTNINTEQNYFERNSFSQNTVIIRATVLLSN